MDFKIFIESLTLKDVVLTAFSGFGVAIFGWFFVGKVKKSKVVQRGNTVKGDMAAGDIIVGHLARQTEMQKNGIDILQDDNTVDGNLSAGKINK